MTLALICGRGDLPARIAAQQAEAPFVCVMEGFDPNGLQADTVFRLETLGSLLIRLGHEGVTDVCFCGAIDRPVIDPAAIDAHTMPLVPLMQEALAQGDDGALRAIAGVFEQTGFRVRAAHDLAPDLSAPPGVLTKAWPDEQMRADAALGAGILAALAPFDVAQACVVGQGALLGVESVAGTDMLLRALPDGPQRAQAILVKTPKEGQDKRLDLPTLGPETVASVVAAGVRGIVVDAGDVILLDRDRVIAECDAHGLVLWSRDGG